MKAEICREALKRLNYIDGHLEGVRKMVEDDRYCVDILKQTYAIRRAIEKLESLILEGHLETCVVRGMKDGQEQRLIAELMDLYSLNQR